jgi:2-polyprenyl-3-methyl-5-hydroxy-6-metoxy-1,4-benzoquinol methylase
MANFKVPQFQALSFYISISSAPDYDERMDRPSILRSCPVCQSTVHTPLFQKGELQLVQCSGCSTVFTNPIEESLATGEFYDQLASPFYLSPDKLESDYSPVRFDRELKLFRRFCKHGRVLDVGCSTGAFLFQLQHRFKTDYEVLGIDVAGPALDHAEKQGIPVLRESYLASNLQTSDFSAVTFWAVVEHLAEPRQFLARTASLLKPAGLCFILVPNFRSLAVRLLGSKYRYIFPQHINYFSLTTLRRFVGTEPRFRIIYSGSTHFNPLVIWQDRKGRGLFVSDEERARLLKRTTGYKQNPLLKPIKVALAGAETILGMLHLADNIVIVLEKVK